MWASTYKTFKNFPFPLKVLNWKSAIGNKWPLFYFFLCLILLFFLIVTFLSLTFWSFSISHFSVSLKIKSKIKKQSQNQNNWRQILTNVRNKKIKSKLKSKRKHADFANIASSKALPSKCKLNQEW